MSMKGSLEDVSVPDVLQFVHLGNRSGTLRLEVDGRCAEIGFHLGRIVSARAPGSKRLGQVLVDAGAVEPAALEAALTAQRSAARPAPLGQLLIERAAITPERLREVVEHHVTATVLELVAWRLGDFEFVLDERAPIDDSSVSPGDILPDVHINTQMVVLEATRLIDERRRDAPPTGGLYADVTPTRPGVSVDGPRLRVQVVSDDDRMVAAIGAALSVAEVHVERVTAAIAGVVPSDELAPVVLVDLRRGATLGLSHGATLEQLEALRDGRPDASLVAIHRGLAPTADVHGAGALATVPPKADVVSACLAELVRVRRASAQRALGDVRPGVDALRRIFGELRAGLASATVSATLMDLVARSVERGVLLLVGKTDLLALSAFGRSATGDALVAQARGLRLPMPGPGTLAECVGDGTSRARTWEEAALPQRLAELVGRPASGRCAIFPLVGSRKVVALVYADNGAVDRPLDDLELLDVATSQAGLVFENELLRRRAAGEAGA